MADLEIDGIGTIEVDDGFRNLSPDQQNSFVQNVIGQIRGSTQQPAPSQSPFAEQQQIEYERAQGMSRIGKGAVEAAKSTPEYLKEIPSGLGNVAIGATQAGLSVLDPSSKSPASQRLAQTVKQRLEAQGKMTPAERAGIATGEILPFMATGGTSIAGMAGAGAAEQFTKPSGQDLTLGERGTEAAVGGATSASIGAGLKLAKKGFEFAREVISPSKEKAIQRFSKLAMNESKPLKEIISEAEEKGLDIYDVLDPRGSASQFANESLVSKRGLAIADKSLKEIQSRSEKIKERVLNAVSKNELDSVEAANIIGANADKLVKAQAEARRLKAAPLYKEGEKGMANLDQIVAKDLTPEDAKELGIEKWRQKLGKQGDVKINLTLKDLLDSPIIRESINIARNKSEQFSKTPGGTIFGNIYSKTVNPAPKGGVKQDLIEYDMPDNSVKVLSAVEKILSDKIGDVALSGNTTEQAALKMARSGVTKVLDEANPTLTKARQTYRDEGEVLKELANTEPGQLAKLYREKKTDRLVKQTQNVFKLQPRNIAQLRESNPEGFKDAVRFSLSDELSSVNTEDLSQVKSMRKKLFGNNDKGVALKAALNDGEAYKGLKDSVDIMEKVAERADFTKGGRIPTKSAFRLPFSRFAFMSETAQGGYEFVFKNPKIADEYARLVLTAEGKDDLKAIAKTQNVDKKIEKINQLIIKAISLPETTAGGEPQQNGI